MNDFKSIHDDESQRHPGGHVPLWLSAEPAEILWLRVSFSAHFDAGGVERWHRRLNTFMSRCGLAAAISPERIAIIPLGKAIASFERGRLIGWLTAQPEVVFAQIEPRTASDSLAWVRPGRLHG